MIELVSRRGERIHVVERVWDEMMRLSRAGEPNETGGVLVGRFTRAEGIPVVRRLGPPPPDSVSGPTHFHRGVEGVNEFLADQRGLDLDYLGEWHSHPSGTHRASWRDRTTMVRIARDPEYHTPNPLLLICAGSDDAGWTLGGWRVTEVCGLRGIGWSGYDVAPDDRINERA